MQMVTTSLGAALAERRRLLEVIALAADAIAVIDRQLPILRSMALEEDLLQAESSDHIFSICRKSISLEEDLFHAEEQALAN
jgi:hypothetical protein